MKQLFSAFLIAVIVGLALVGAVNLGAAQTSSVKGTLSSDATWTKAGSPYVLTGPFCVAEGVTLRIESGVTVDLADYHMQVDGTLYARGSSADKIVFNSNIILYDNERIVFTDVSNSWNEQTGTGCIIENAVINSISISIGEVSPKISGNAFNDESWSILLSVDGGSPIISNNTMIFNGDCIRSVFGSPLISDNFIKSTKIASTGISINGVVGGGSTATIVRNTIINNRYGIRGWGGFQIIEGNVIQNNQIGIVGGGTIRNNTIENSSVALESPAAKSVIMYNNIIDYSQNSVLLGEFDTFDINATYNWWGTTNTAQIDQSIHDFEDDSSLGKVNYIPFLTEPNPAVTSPIQDPSQSGAPTPTPNPTPEPSPSIQETKLTITCSSVLSSDFFAIITGRLTADGVGVANVPVLLSYHTNTDESWIDFATADTDSNGNFIDTWTPPETGTYLLRAAWAGDEYYPSANATVTLAATSFEQNFFSVTTNSTLTELFFNSANRELRFQVEGADWTTGYVNVYVPQNFLKDTSDLKAYLDDNETSYSLESKYDSWLLSFTYSHSTHQVTINFGAANFIDEQQLGQALVLGLPITTLILLFAIMKLKDRKTENNDNSSDDAGSEEQQSH